ncbi:MAG: cation:proton antiporter [Brevirhabdus sp.]
MAIDAADGALNPVTAIALVGALGVGAQWLAWRLNMPAIVLMLVAGILVGPVAGVLEPARDLGPITGPMISIAVAIILFEGGLTLNFHSLSDAAKGVRRLVVVGAPLGWLMSTLALRFGAGLSWESSAVFGGIMIVTGPTVIAPLLRQARLSRRPAALLQWEAIVNDPIGALAAVLAFEVVLVLNASATVGEAVSALLVGVAVASALGLAAGYGIATSFKRGWVPEYMKVPVLFVVLIGIFSVSDVVLHESGLLAVTLMGVVIANAQLPSYEELRRFKEHATVLLVSGVFILLAASLDFAQLGQLDWHAAAFVAAVVLIARPLTVFLSLIGTGLPRNEQVLIAFTGPRGVVLVAVAGLFGERLAAMGVADGALIGPLAFVLVAATVVLHGFTLKPFARFLGVTGADKPGVLLVGGSTFNTAFARALNGAGVPVLLSDPNHGHLRAARIAGLPTFFGDILSEAAEQHVELVGFATLVAATDNDAYNTLVTTDLAPEFGRDNVYQVVPEKAESARHALPATLGGRAFACGRSFSETESLMAEGWSFAQSELREGDTLDTWRAAHPQALLMARVLPSGEIGLLEAADQTLRAPVGSILVHLVPPGTVVDEEQVASSA